MGSRNIVALWVCMYAVVGGTSNDAKRVLVGVMEDRVMVAQARTVTEGKAMAAEVCKQSPSSSLLLSVAHFSSARKEV